MGGGVALGAHATTAAGSYYYHYCHSAAAAAAALACLVNRCGVGLWARHCWPGGGRGQSTSSTMQIIDVDGQGERPRPKFIGICLERKVSDRDSFPESLTGPHRRATWGRNNIKIYFRGSSLVCLRKH